MSVNIVLKKKRAFTRRRWVRHNIFDNPRENLFFNLASISKGFFPRFFFFPTTGYKKETTGEEVGGKRRRRKKKGARINSFQMPTCSYPSSTLIFRYPYMRFPRSPIRSIRFLISRRVTRSTFMCVFFCCLFICTRSISDF